MTLCGAPVRIRIAKATFRPDRLCSSDLGKLRRNDGNEIIFVDRLLVTLCTYNERENLPRLLDGIRHVVPEADVLIVDDSSPDGTGAIAAREAAGDPRLHVIHRAGKGGIGSATLAAFEFGIAGEYRYLLNMDADMSHRPEDIPALLACMDQVDVAIGSRYVPGGTIRGWKLIRHVMSRGVNWLSRMLLGLSPHDASGSFRCYRVCLLTKIPFSAIVSKGYAFEEEILFRCRLAGARFAETPIHFEDRRAGRSKINGYEVVRALRDLGLLALENFRSPPPEAAPRREQAPAGKNP